MAWLHIHYNSKALRMPTAMEVLLPEMVGDTERGVSVPGPYKTLYLLHGKRQDHTSWLRKSSIERYVAGLPLAVVMPRVNLSWYSDMKRGRNYLSLITEELPELCSGMFDLSARREDRFVAGLSMGGYGAVKAALAAPRVFGAAASLSGVLDIARVYERKDPGNIEDALGTWEEARGSENDLFASAERYPKDITGRFYIRCGTEDSRHSHSVKFRDHARAQGLHVEYAEEPGDHTWEYWDACIPGMLKFFLEANTERGL